MNTFKTGILLASLTGLLITFGYLIGGSYGAYSFLAISMIMNIVSFWFSDKIALGMSKATPLPKESAPQVHAMNDELSAKMGIPSPRLYLIPASQPNAFATGRGPGNSAVALSDGLLKIMSQDEIKGVLAHELAHIKNRDVLTSTVAAVIAGAISSLANIALWFGGGDDRNKNPFLSIVAIILAPIAASLIQLAISRSREFAADETAATFTGQPSSLANALLKIEDYVKQIPMNVNPAMSSLYIQNPISTGTFAKLFSTHPPTGERVARLERMNR